MRMRRTVMVIAFAVFLSFAMAGCTGGCDKAYSVSGKAVDPDGAGIAGVALAYTGKVSGAVRTDASGNWSITGIKGSTTISLSHDLWYFNPSQYTVVKEQSNLTWVGIPAFTDELRAQLENTRNEVDGLFSRVYDPDNPEDSLAQIAQEASSNPGVDWVRSDSHSLVLEHKNGGVDIERTLPGDNRAAVIYTYDDDVGMNHHEPGSKK